MKGSLLWKLAYVFCALAGILAGYGVFSLADAGEYPSENITKDNTLLRESGDSVFFDEAQGQPAVTTVPAVTVTLTPIPTAVPTSVPIETPVPSRVPEEVEILPELPAITEVPEEIVSDGPEDALPSLGRQWAGKGITAVPEQEPVFRKPPEETEKAVTEVITYPAKIFGQTPVVNRSDAYVSYFEFCYDLIAMMEPEVQARGLNMNALMTKFALKALFCGVDIEQLDINAPIPRRLAALCLWLAAQVLNEGGCDTSSQSAGRYVTDISSCSVSERRAIAYLYEQGVVKGYQTAGQEFYPDAGLKSETGESWLLGVKQCWK